MDGRNETSLQQKQIIHIRRRDSSCVASWWPWFTYIFWRDLASNEPRDISSLNQTIYMPDDTGLCRARRVQGMLPPNKQKYHPPPPLWGWDFR
jgi:hypothetical protein